MLNAAIGDGVILSNPRSASGRQLRLVTRAGERQEAIKAFTRDLRPRVPPTGLGRPWTSQG